jgi:orotidine-5'-phosphate decarboxylase
MKVKDRLIVALDVATRREALEWVARLRGQVGLFKIGSQLFTAEGPDLVRDMVRQGEKVFLDLKFHDIPDSVTQSVLAAAELGVEMLTLHSSGGLKMMASAAESLNRVSTTANRPLLLGVTVLTSLTEDDLRRLGFSSSMESQVVLLAKLAEEAGLNGVVASPSELTLLRGQLKASTKIVTPGIRPASSALDDQNRIATPSAAIQAGADYLVIGRPITASPDPLGSLREIVSAIESCSRPQEAD